MNQVLNQVLPYLTIKHPDGTEQTFDLTKDMVAIGRCPADSDIALTDDLVSRNHCIIERKSGGYWMITDRSRNGTYRKRDGVKTRLKLDHQECLEIDDEISICKWQLVFKDPNRTRHELGREPKPQSNVADGYVFCLSQKTLFLIEKGDRKAIELRAKLIDLLTCLAQHNLASSKPMLVDYDELCRFIWGANENAQGENDIYGLAAELRKVIGDSGLKTKKTKGYILNITCED